MITWFLCFLYRTLQHLQNPWILELNRQPSTSNNLFDSLTTENLLKMMFAENAAPFLIGQTFQRWNENFGYFFFTRSFLAMEFHHHACSKLSCFRQIINFSGFLRWTSRETKFLWAKEEEIVSSLWATFKYNFWGGRLQCQRNASGKWQ